MRTQHTGLRLLNRAYRCSSLLRVGLWSGPNRSEPFPSSSPSIDHWCHREVSTSAENRAAECQAASRDLDKSRGRTLIVNHLSADHQSTSSCTRNKTTPSASNTYTHARDGRPILVDVVNCRTVTAVVVPAAAVGTRVGVQVRLVDAVLKPTAKE